MRNASDNALLPWGAWWLRRLTPFGFAQSTRPARPRGESGLAPLAAGGGFSVGDVPVAPAANRVGATRVDGKAMDVLEQLARHAPQPVSARDLIDEVWAYAEVSDNALYKAINQLRKAFGDDARHPEYLETVPGKGYRLVQPIVSLRSAAPPVPARRRARRRAAHLGIAAAALAILGTVLGLVMDPSPRPIRILPVDVSPRHASTSPHRVFDAISSHLSMAHGFTLVGAASTLARATPADHPGIVEQLQATHLLEVAVHPLDDGRLSVAVRLVETASEARIFVADYDTATRAGFLNVIKQQVGTGVAQALFVEMALRPGSYELRVAPDSRQTAPVKT